MGSSSSSSDGERHRKSKKRRSKSSKKSKKKQKRETSAERADRKRERKQLKQELEAQKLDQITNQMTASLGYTNTDNPFGDSNLHSKFVWEKKRLQEQKLGITAKDREAKLAQKEQQTKADLEALKEKRLQREIDLKLREQENERMAREADNAALGDWETREDVFHLQQAKQRATIRIKDGRAKPIDILAINLSLGTDTDVAEEIQGLGLNMDLQEPYLIMKGLEKAELKELKDDIQLYLGLEKNEKNREFWECMMTIVNDELVKTQPHHQNYNIGVSQQVLDQIQTLLSKKTTSQLLQLETQVHQKLDSNEPIDVEYWEELLKQLSVWKSKAKVKEMHNFLLAARGIVSESCGQTISSRFVNNQNRIVENLVETGIIQENMQEDDEEEEEELPVDEYESCMSPILFKEIPREDHKLDVIEDEDDYQDLLEMRRKVLLGKVTKKSEFSSMVSKKKAAELSALSGVALVGASSSKAFAMEEDDFESNFIREASKNIVDGEEVFSSEALSDEKKLYLWQDKYAPRKPRYFNRVLTAFEWNKYNQTHYDTDNPPPKVVQGYKFNIFYPDLIDKTTAPTYKVIKDPNDEDTCILRFMAGPPYEDIAFRIVKKEWEHSHRFGFKCFFDRGVLQLHFHFRTILPSLNGGYFEVVYCLRYLINQSFPAVKSPHTV